MSEHWCKVLVSGYEGDLCANCEHVVAVQAWWRHAFECSVWCLWLDTDGDGQPVRLDICKKNEADNVDVCIGERTVKVLR